MLTSLFKTFTVATITCLFLAIQASSASAPQPITFNALGIPLSKFKIRQLKAKGIENPKPKLGIELKANLALPTGEGPFPAIILSHDCRGMRAFHNSYVEFLVANGFATLFIDTYGSRSVENENICANIANWDTKDFIASRSKDIYGAIEYLKTRDDINSNKIGLLGWDRDSTMSAIAKQGIAQSNANLVPQAAVSIYPDCRRMSSGEFIAPLLVVVAENDDWWPASSCTKMLEAAKNTTPKPDLISFPNTAHGFDDPENEGGTIIEDAYNPNKTPAMGATFSYDKLASQKVLEVILSFFKSNLTH